jgi:hypothetical protein
LKSHIKRIKDIVGHEDAASVSHFDGSRPAVGAWVGITLICLTFSMVTAQKEGRRSEKDGCQRAGSTLICLTFSMVMV